MKKYLLSAFALALAGCSTLPSSGPSQSSVVGLQDSSDKKTPTVDVVEMNDSVANSLFERRQAQSFQHFDRQSGSYAGRVDAGDVLDIMIWEAPPALLFGSVLDQTGTGGAHVTNLPAQTVAQNGTISLPFIGAMNVRGKTPEQIQNDIIARLNKKANQPQAVVRLSQNNSANVTVLRQGNSIRMPLTAVNERVLDAVAAVGGATENIQNISVQLARGNQVKTVSLETLAATPSENIPLRSGDVVTLLNNPLSFTALGAVGTNKQIKFAAKGLNLAEAIGEMGGLLDRRADAKGVFIFRYVPFAQLDYDKQATWQSRGYTMGMDVPTVYRVNLLEPQSIFWLQRFPVQDKDVVYVSNAPLSELQKFLSILVSPVVSTTNSVNNLAN